MAQSVSAPPGVKIARSPVGVTDPRAESGEYELAAFAPGVPTNAGCGLRIRGSGIIYCRHISRSYEQFESS
jgi:hypothetical protein